MYRPAASSLLLPVSLMYHPWYTGSRAEEIQEEGSAKLRRIGAVDAVADFSNADCAQYNRNLSNRLEHTFHGLGCGTIPPFGGDQNAGVEN
jgi:hypothetical protein